MNLKDIIPCAGEILGFLPSAKSSNLTRAWYSIAEKFKSLASQKVKIHKTIIFGSRARGASNEESDLDMFVVVDQLDHSIEKYISDCAWEIGFSEDVVIIPITISFDKLQNTPIRESAFIKNVFREGIII